jgi:glycine/D-amino acid oxidase-like deaminating enzyme
MSISFWLDRSNKHKQVSCDVIIIGGGIAGISTAYWLLQKDPQLKISIVEKRRLGAGATGRNAGFITCGSVEHFSRLVTRLGPSQAHSIWQFSEENLRLLQQHLPLTLNKHGFAQSGSFSLASSEAELNELKSTAQIMSDLGIANEVLSTTAVQKRLGAQGFVGGIKYNNDASVNPIALIQEILEKTPCSILEDTEYIDFQRQGSTLRVHTDRTTLQCDLLIFAANGYLPTLHPYFHDKVFPTRGQVLITKPVKAFMEGPCYANFVLDYFRQLPTGEVLIGGFRQLEIATEVGYSDHITPRIQDALYEFIQKHLPQVKDAPISHRWSGVMGFSVDGQPMIGALPQDPQVFFVGGFTGHGLGLAFHCSKALVDLIYGHPCPHFLTAKRFQ